MFPFPAQAVIVLGIKIVAFQFPIHMVVIMNGLIFTPLTKVQPLEPYFALSILMGNQTKLIVISKTLMEKLLMRSLLLVL